MFDALLPGLAASFAPINLAYITFGLLVGFAVGVLPGLNRSAAVAIAIPISFYLPPVTAISFLIGIARAARRAARSRPSSSTRQASHPRRPPVSTAIPWRGRARRERRSKWR